MRDITERFWSHVEKSEGCWIWTAGRLRHGYGAFNISTGKRSGKTVSAHRMALALSLGHEIPSDRMVLHSCDNPPCVNPAHLRMGTCAENHEDAKSRNRTLVGSRNPKARLTEGDVMAIRLLLADGRSRVSIARDFGVSYSLIDGIANGRRWKHVSDAEVAA